MTELTGGGAQRVQHWTQQARRAHIEAMEAQEADDDVGVRIQRVRDQVHAHAADMHMPTLTSMALIEGWLLLELPWACVGAKLKRDSRACGTHAPCHPPFSPPHGPTPTFPSPRPYAPSAPPTDCPLQVDAEDMLKAATAFHKWRHAHAKQQWRRQLLEIHADIHAEEEAREKLQHQHGEASARLA